MPNIWSGTLVTWGCPALIAAIVAGGHEPHQVGFEIRAVGLNPQTARMNGMSVSKVAIVTFALGRWRFRRAAGSIFILGINGPCRRASR
jgi:ABC-type uncharacterized transport system permease subunit